MLNVGLELMTDIKSLMLYRLSQPGTPPITFLTCTLGFKNLIICCCGNYTNILWI